MRFGFVLPGGDARTCAELAHEAEAAGWDGVFVPDCIWIGAANGPTYDPWVVLAAMAMRTQRVRLGTMLTALPRRRPWKLARETVSLDYLSGGRLILSVGLGTLDDGGITRVGEPTDRKIRARMLDEGLAILAGLWSGRPFSFRGQHYRVEEMTFLPPPVQTPRIPVWVVGAWGSRRSMARALRWDGLLPNRVETPEDWRALKTYLAEHRPAGAPYDLVVEGETPGGDPAAAAAKLRPYVEAGATWWLETMWSEVPVIGAMERVRARVRQGPPARHRHS